jgi:gp16 family phage-associated protein
MRTPEQALSEIRHRGETVSGWAKKHGFDPRLVRAVIYGRVKGRWGESHKIAVMLGIKDGVIDANV